MLKNEIDDSLLIACGDRGDEPVMVLDGQLQPLRHDVGARPEERVADPGVIDEETVETGLEGLWCINRFRLPAGAGMEAAPLPRAFMPYKYNEPRRHRIPKARYKVSNWREYDEALQQRGSLTVWVTPEALEAWAPAKTGQRGRPTSYSDIVIETAVMLRLAMGKPWWQTEGMLRSIIGCSASICRCRTTRPCPAAALACPWPQR